MEAKKVRSGSRDAISCFPDEILSKILSFLPTKRAVSTSLLSKRWKNLFPLMIHIFASQHHFDFDESDLLYPEEVCKRERKDLHKSFIDFVDKTISGSNSMEKLSLKCQHGLISHELTDQWIRHALDRGVVDLDMCLITRLITETNQPLRKSWVLEAFLGLRTDEVPEPNQLPPTVFMNKTLVKLTLGIYFGRIPIQFPKVFLPVLKSLFLHSVWYTNETLCDTLLLGSPILEELTLHHLRAVTEPHLDNSQDRMTHKTLKRLTFHYNNSFLFSRKMSFNIPSLVYLDYSGLAPYPSSKVGFVDSLVEAKLDVDIQKTHDVYNHLVTIINSMRNVETLSLSSTSVKAMYSNCEEVPFFLNLVRLYFESNTKEGWEVLPRLLNKSPKLETLVLKGLHCVDNQGVLIDDKYEVKVVEIHGFRGSDREMRQMKCYLWQMHFLQVMKFEVDVDDDNKKPQLINELLALPKHVSKCKIQFL